MNGNGLRGSPGPSAPSRTPPAAERCGRVNPGSGWEGRCARRFAGSPTAASPTAAAPAAPGCRRCRRGVPRSFRCSARRRRMARNVRGGSARRSTRTAAGGGGPVPHGGPCDGPCDVLRGSPAGNAGAGGVRLVRRRGGPGPGLCWTRARGRDPQGRGWAARARNRRALEEAHRPPRAAVVPDPAGRTRGRRRAGLPEETRPVRPDGRGAPEGTRTPNLLIRSQMLYPLSYGRRCRVAAAAVDYFSGLRAGSPIGCAATPPRPSRAVEGLPGASAHR